VVLVCLIPIALGCDRNGYKCRHYIVVKVVDSPRIIERAIGHEVSNEIDVKRRAMVSSLLMSDVSSYKNQGTRK